MTETMLIRCAILCPLKANKKRIFIKQKPKAFAHQRCVKYSWVGGNVTPPVGPRDPRNLVGIQRNSRNTKLDMPKQHPIRGVKVKSVDKKHFRIVISQFFTYTNYSGHFWFLSP